MIDNLLQKKLRERFNPDDSPLRKHQLKMLEMLVYIDSICKENGIKYWLSSGTCLGAVRHGGFIPWDDDVDIEMMRDDYLKFLHVFKESSDYVLQTYKNDRFYSTQFAKMRDKNSCVYDSLYMYKGVFVDIFCLEYTNKSITIFLDALHKPLNYLYKIIKIRSLKDSRNNLYLSVLFDVYKFFYFKSLHLFRGINSILPNKMLRHTLGTGWVDNVRFEQQIFPLTSIKFEGIDFPIPGDFSAYLKNIYGDYMKIPELDKIDPPHVQYFNS